MPDFMRNQKSFVEIRASVFINYELVRLNERSSAISKHGATWSRGFYVYVTPVRLRNRKLQRLPRVKPSRNSLIVIFGCKLPCEFGCLHSIICDPLTLASLFFLVELVHQ